MSDGASVPVAVVGSRAEAYLIVGLLNSYGLRASVAADDAGEQEPQLQVQGVRVLVAPRDVVPARRLLAAEEGPRAGGRVTAAAFSSSGRHPGPGLGRDA